MIRMNEEIIKDPYDNNETKKLQKTLMIIMERRNY